MPRNRASLKGQGAKIFFGDDQVPEAAEDSPTTGSSPDKLETPEASNIDLARDRAIASLSSPGRITATFRFSQAELDALDDLVTQLRTEHGARVPKQYIVRLGLSALLADYRINPDESLLLEYIDRAKEV